MAADVVMATPTLPRGGPGGGGAPDDENTVGSGSSSEIGNGASNDVEAGNKRGPPKTMLELLQEGLNLLQDQCDKFVVSTPEAPSSPGGNVTASALPAAQNSILPRELVEPLAAAHGERREALEQRAAAFKDRTKIQRDGILAEKRKEEARHAEEIEKCQGLVLELEQDINAKWGEYVERMEKGVELAAEDEDDTSEGGEEDVVMLGDNVELDCRSTTSDAPLGRHPPSSTSGASTTTTAASTSGATTSASSVEEAGLPESGPERVAVLKKRQQEILLRVQYEVERKEYELQDLKDMVLRREINMSNIMQRIQEQDAGLFQKHGLQANEMGCYQCTHLSQQQQAELQIRKAQAQLEDLVVEICQKQEHVEFQKENIGFLKEDIARISALHSWSERHLVPAASAGTQTSEEWEQIKHEFLSAASPQGAREGRDAHAPPARVSGAMAGVASGAAARGTSFSRTARTRDQQGIAPPTARSNRSRGSTGGTSTAGTAQTMGKASTNKNVASPEKRQTELGIFNCIRGLQACKEKTDAIEMEHERDRLDGEEKLTKTSSSLKKKVPKSLTYESRLRNPLRAGIRSSAGSVGAVVSLNDNAYKMKASNYLAERNKRPNFGSRSPPIGGRVSQHAPGETAKGAKPPLLATSAPREGAGAEFFEPDEDQLSNPPSYDGEMGGQLLDEKFLSDDDDDDADGDPSIHDIPRRPMPSTPSGAGENGQGGFLTRTSPKRLGVAAADKKMAAYMRSSEEGGAETVAPESTRGVPTNCENRMRTKRGRSSQGRPSA
eukprot:g789.t1